MQIKNARSAISILAWGVIEIISVSTNLSLFFINSLNKYSGVQALQ
jgi:hypothetical protein